ncbi:MAG TPA: hypothetical protein VH497_15385 [Vicinamibacterales bacterium]|jgi:hypothetical protein
MSPLRSRAWLSQGRDQGPSIDASAQIAGGPVFQDGWIAAGVEARIKASKTTPGVVAPSDRGLIDRRSVRSKNLEKHGLHAL